MDSGNTAFLLISAAFVLFMTPGLAFFYGGMVRAKSVVSMMMLSFGSLGLVAVLWVLYGYAISFARSSDGTFIGIPGWFGINLGSVGLSAETNSVLSGEQTSTPSLAFVAFHATFAIITVALLSGAIADRAKFSAWLLFSGLWVTFVYAPVAHAAFTSDGFLAKTIGSLDFAGGTVVEINSGAAALALALVLGRREGFKRDPMRPHNMPLVLLGAGLLWFGWFGFNSGSALQASSLAATAMINTQVATAAAAMSWLLVEKRREGKA